MIEYQETKTFPVRQQTKSMPGSAFSDRKLKPCHRNLSTFSCLLLLLLPLLVFLVFLLWSLLAFIFPHQHVQSLVRQVCIAWCAKNCAAGDSCCLRHPPEPEAAHASNSILERELPVTEFVPSEGLTLVTVALSG